MKGITKKIILTFFSLATAISAFGQTQEVNPKTGFPTISQKPFVIFNEGVAFSHVTRVQVQDKTNNFVLRDNMLGAFFQVETVNMRPLNSFLRVAAYSPLVSTFNRIPQPSKQTLVFGFDMFYAPFFETNMWNYLKIKIGPGFHFLYQTTDDWNYIHLGAGGTLGVELPLTKNWTLLANGYLTWDYANFGTNRRMFNLDYSWMYQIEAGVRYSKKKSNTYSYIDSRRSTQEPATEQ